MNAEGCMTLVDKVTKEWNGHRPLDSEAEALLSDLIAATATYVRPMPARGPRASVSPGRKCGGTIDICVDAGEHKPPCECVRPSGHGGPHMSGGAW